MSDYLQITTKEYMDIPLNVKIGKTPGVTEDQIVKMLHAIGADHKKARKYLNKMYYHAYRNYYDAGGDDVDVWNDLVEKGYAEKGRCYHVTGLGLDVLELLTGSVIYADYDNYADCRDDVLKEFMEDSVYCGYGCWNPTAATAIARRLHLPLTLAREACRNLVEEGYLVKDYCGGMDDDGHVHCYHGYYVTDKTRAMDEWKVLWKKERDYIDSMVKDGDV